MQHRQALEKYGEELRANQHSSGAQGEEEASGPPVKPERAGGMRFPRSREVMR